MKKSIVSLFLILSVAASFSFAQRKKPAQVKPKPATTAQQTKPVQTAAIEIPFVNRTLPNGLEVIVLPDNSVPLVTVEIAVRNGSFTETPDLNGLSHLYEHMFFKPNSAILILNCERARSERNNDYYFRAGCEQTLKIKPRVGDTSYLYEIDDIGITSNASTREEVVNYFLNTTSPHLAIGMQYMSHAIRFPTFDEQDLDDEIRVVVGEIDRNESNPFFYLDRAINDKLYFKYPSRKNPLGTRASVLAATTEKMRLIQNRYYVPNNSALVVTGDVDAEAVFALAEKYFGGWERREVDPFKEFPMVEHPPLPKSEGTIVEKNVESNGQENVFIQIGWHGPSIGKDDAATYSADVFSYILAQPDSRFQRALADSGLAASASINYYTQRNVGPIQVVLVTSPDRAKAAVRALYTEIAQFDKPTYFTDEELESAKTILESRDLFDREKLSEYAHTLGFWWSSTGIEYFRGYHKKLRAVTRQEINRYVKTYIQGKNHIGVALVSPRARAEANLTEADLIGK
ncbi:MAG: insulinase family protein [Acidobacteria bacterium]|nr:insulinase family protein [Acidobacteriota bacterium]